MVGWRRSRRLSSTSFRARLVVVLAMTAGVMAPAFAQLPADSERIDHIHGLAVDARDPEVLYVATHTGLVRLHPTTGAEWVGSGFDLMGFTAPPGAGDLMYASGHPDLATYRVQKSGNLGLLVSRDRGRTWRSVLLRGDADFHALTYSPRQGGELYGWSVAGRPGLYRISTRRWVAERVPTPGLSDVLSLAAGPDPAGALLAGAKGGLFASRDRGGTWTRVTGIPAAPVTAVAYHATDGATAYAAVTAREPRVLRSRDGGATWEAPDVTIPPGSAVVALAVGPGEHVVLATSQSAVLRSRDGGRTWQAVVERGRAVAGPR